MPWISKNLKFKIKEQDFKKLRNGEIEEPTISPKMAKNVAALKCFKKYEIIFDPIKSPNKTPNPTTAIILKFNLWIASITL